MRCLSWNLEWATGSSKRGEAIAAVIEELHVDVVCFTEVTPGMYPPGAHPQGTHPQGTAPKKQN